MNTIAFIPARGQSKRLPQKNIKLFDGKPLIYYTIQFAIQSNLFSRISVSTDSPEIKTIALQYGAEVVDRPPALADDYASTGQAAAHTWQFYKEKGIEFTSFVTLQITNPLRTTAMLEKALKIFYSKDVDSVMSVSKNHHKFGKIENELFKPDYPPGQRSQDVDPRYNENGLLYITKPQQISQGKILGDTIYPMVVDDLFGGFDIDNQLDFDITEFVYKKNKHLFNF